ncbi:MAG: endo-1,4-beta-xylanase [Phycisphaeraceae bacterium]|nr:endo-1,4-beta-xylanase [Phycisphaeraceae bacterium]
MLKFAVFDESGPATAWNLRHQHLIGSDDVVVPSEIAFEGGLIQCRKRIDGSAALGLQFPVADESGGEGSLLTLRTCLLRDREEPYLLSLELARYRILLLLNKLEEWALFGEPADDPAMRLVEQARDAFTHALVEQHYSAAVKGRGGYTPAADRAARSALALALKAGEALALLQSRVMYARRLNGTLAAIASQSPPANAITDHEARAGRAALLGSPGVILPEPARIGCSVNPAQFTPELCALAQQACDFVTIPMRWVEMEPTEGKYAFARTDKWIEWAVTKAKLPVTAGPVVDFHARSAPRWLGIWEHDYETLRDVVFEHVKALVTRYRRTVGVWTVCSGLHAGNGFSLTPEQAIDLTRTCVMVVRKLQPTAKVQVEIAQPWGEYTGEAGPKGARSIPPTVYCDFMQQVQCHVDAWAVRLQMGQPEPGKSARDLLAISAMLDRFAAFDVPVAVTAMGCPAAPLPAPGDGELEPGHWRRHWNPEHQAEWMAHLGAIIAAKPFVTSLCWQDLYDPSAQAEMPAGGLATASGAARPVARVLSELRGALRGGRPILPGSA